LTLSWPRICRYKRTKVTRRGIRYSSQISEARLREPHTDIMPRAVQIVEANEEEVAMEGRIARIEADVAHIRSDVAEIEADIRGQDSKLESLRDKMDSLREKMEAEFTEVRQSIAQLSVALERAYRKSKVATIATRVWALMTLGGILLIMARAFKWI